MALPAPATPSLGQLLDELPVGLLVTDHRGTILQANGTLCTWAGYTADELVGRRKLQDLFTVGGRIFHQTHWMPILQMQGSISEVKFDLRRSDGRVLTVMLNAVRKAACDVVSVTIAEERNKYERQLLLERKRADALAEREVRAQQVLQIAESRLRQAVRLGALHLWSADDTGTRHFEPSVAALLRLGEARAVVEADFAQAILPQDRDAEDAAFRRALGEPGVMHSWTFTIRDAAGSTRALQASGQAFPDAALGEQRFVGVLSDITEQVRKSAEAEDRALFAEQMVGIVSHDLRNPLSAIMMGATVMARDDAMAARHRRVLDSINRSSLRAKRLIEELLDFTLVRVGHGLAVTREPTDVHELAARCVDELTLAFPANPIRHQAQGPGICSLDADRVAQLLGNLVANAVTYGTPGGVITVTSTGGADGFMLAVHNLGTPVPPAMLERIFEPLVRGHTGGDQSVRNVGLGLFIVKAIAAAHQGSVTVTSTAEAGTTFTFAFGRGPAD